MAPRKLSADASLKSTWYEVAYTRARVGGDTNAEDFAAALDPLLAEIEQVRRAQQRSWMGALEAQALCDNLRGKLDDLIGDVAATLLYIDKDRRAPRVARYLKLNPHQLARLGLESKVEAVRGWSDSLKTEPEPSLTDLGTRLAALVDEAMAALAAQRTAESARIDFRVRVINTLVDRLNDARFALYVQLVRRAEEKKLGKHWPGRFFKAKAKSSPRRQEKPASADEADQVLKSPRGQ